MRLRSRLLPVTVVALVSVGAALAQGSPDDLPLAFRSTGLADEAEQPLATYPEVEPGDSAALKRGFPGAPPQVPHSFDDSTIVSTRENDCLDCHLPENATGKDDVPIPESHFKRPVIVEEAKEGLEGHVGGYELETELYGGRHNCSTCHVPQASNAPDAGTTFVRLPDPPAEPAAKPKKGKGDRKRK